MVSRTAEPAARSSRPLLLAVALLFAFEAVAVGATLALDRTTGLDGKARDLVAEALLAIGVVGLIAIVRWWRSTSLTTPVREWRNPGLVVLPILFTLIPFAGGIRGGIDGSTIAILVVGYALNSIAEDGMFRGVMPRVLRTRGLLVAVVVSSLLFGLAHFGNLVSRPDQSVAIAAAQALGAFTQGIGLVALRLATNTIWPVMLVHFLGDLFGQIGGMPVVLANVVESVLMLLFGVWVYRRYRGDMQASLDAADPHEAGAIAARVDAPGHATSR